MDGSSGFCRSLPRNQIKLELAQTRSLRNRPRPYALEDVHASTFQRRLVMKPTLSDRPENRNQARETSPNPSSTAFATSVMRCRPLIVQHTRHTQISNEPNPSVPSSPLHSCARVSLENSGRQLLLSEIWNSPLPSGMSGRPDYRSMCKRARRRSFPLTRRQACWSRIDRGGF